MPLTNPTIDSSLASDANIHLYVDSFDGDMTAVASTFDFSEDLIPAYNAAASIYMDETDFRNTFQMKIPAENDPNGAFLYGVSKGAGAVNMTDKAAADYYYINPAQADVMNYTTNYPSLPSHNGYGAVTEQEDVLNGTTAKEWHHETDKYNINYKVCHDYVRYMATELGISGESHLFNNRNQIILDILKKGTTQSDAIRQHFAGEVNGEVAVTDDNVEYTGHDIVEKIYDQLKKINPARADRQEDNVSAAKSKLVNKTGFQPLPIISGDVLCFKFTFNALSGLNTLPTSDNSSSSVAERVYLIKLCIVDDGQSAVLNKDTLVVDFDSNQTTNNADPNNDEELLAIVASAGNVQSEFPNMTTNEENLAFFRGHTPQTVDSSLAASSAPASEPASEPASGLTPDLYPANRKTNAHINTVLGWTEGSKTFTHGPGAVGSLFQGDIINLLRTTPSGNSDTLLLDGYSFTVVSATNESFTVQENVPALSNGNEYVTIIN